MLSKFANLLEPSARKEEQGPSDLNPLRGWVNLPRAHHLLPYESYDETTKLFYNKGTTGFVLQGEPLAGASLADQGQLSDFFRQKEFLPEGCSVQFLLHASPRIDNFLDGWADSRIPGIYKTMAQRRAAFLKEKTKPGQSLTTLRDYKLLISYTVPGHVEDIIPKEQLMEVRTQLQQALRLVGLPTRVLDADGFISELSNILNIKGETRLERRKWNPHDIISRQIIDQDMSFEVTPDYVVCEDTVVRSFVPKQSPNYWALPHMDRFLGDLLSHESSVPCEFFLHYGLFVETGQAGSKSKMISRRETLENSLKNRMTKWVVGLEEEYKEADDALKEVNRGERVILTCFSATLICPKEHLSKSEAKLKHIWNAAGWEATPTKYDHLPMLLGSLPMTWTMGEEKNLSTGGLTKKIIGFGHDLQMMGKAKRTITKEAQNMLPILAGWKGQASPGMLLYQRQGQVFCWNPFSHAFLPNAENSQTDHNYGGSIVGGSGSGKSVFMQELMITTLGVGGRVFVLDYGRSFKKSCHLLQGQHIEFDIRRPLSLNPFSNIPADMSEASIEIKEEMLATIKPILQVMAAPKQGTTDLQNSLLERALRTSWEKNGPKASIDDIQAFLLDREEQGSKDLGEMLFPYSGRGVYGRFFSGEAQAKLDDDLVVIETDHLRNHPSLMAVLVQMMILQINQTMARGDRKRPFLIIIDEAWKLLAGKDAGAFISESGRISRKYKGGIWTATQHITDYFMPDCPAATEAFNGSAWKCFLNQPADMIRSLRSHDQLKSFVENDYQEQLLTSVRSTPPHYSEIALFGPSVNGVIGRLSLDPFSRLLYSTNPEEYQMLESYMAEGMSVDRAIERAIQEGRA
jgi:conjugal transfer ATP-binding protein TraC